MSPKPIRIVAYILIVVGLIGLAWSFQPSEGTTTGELPAGEGYYSYVKISMWLNGHVKGDFEVTSGSGTVHLYILDSAQYEDYRVDGVSENMFSSIGSSGPFSADLPTMSTYYLVVDHASTTEAKTVRMTYKVSGLDVKFLVGGAVALAIGAVLAMVGMRMKAKEVAAAPPPAPGVESTGEVVMFGKKT